MSGKRATYPNKRKMNLFYKPDRTTKPATISLYVLFVLTCLLGLSKLLVYDLWEETQQAVQAQNLAQSQLNGVLAELEGYDQVREEYNRYSATEEEQALIDRMQVLAMLEEAAGAAQMNAISISGTTVQVQFSGVTLAQTAEIVRNLEASPIVARTVVNTASTTQEAAALVRASVLIYLQKEEGQP